MTRTRVLAALIMAPAAILGILFLPTEWMVMLAALLFLAGLWEWLELAEIEDTLARTVLLVANLALMVALVWASRTSSGINYVLIQLTAVLGVVWAADTGAYFTGRKLGRRKLAPNISPNKTIEGMAGGVIAGVITGTLVGLLAGAEPHELGWVALVSMVAALASVIGDLFECLLKRHAGVKDSGHLIPGHGGILDRIDGVLAALPVFALGKAVAGF